MGPSTWRALLAESAARLADRAEARRIIDQAGGWPAAELVLHLDETPTMLARRRVDEMVARRAAGEPLQYVLGGWGFRSLDLLVDRRALIPRPETEVVVDVALAELDRLDVAGRHAVVVDLGTGSGAIGLAIAAERPAVDVWVTDTSSDALDVARANLAGLGRAGARVRVAHGNWFEALPPELRGRIDLVVSNPPYVAAGDPLPAEVRDWEPLTALVAGPTGLEEIERIVRAVPGWLGRPGALVVEIGETQRSPALAMAAAADLRDATVRPDLTGRDRVLVARAR